MTLEELHDATINHPYRLSSDTKYKKNYVKLLYELSHSFYESIKSNDKFKHGNFGMIHDFNSAIFSMDVMHIERWLSTIHKFIDTGDILSYQLNYTGCNILKSRNRLTKYVYSKKSKKFIPEFSKEELDNCIGEIEKYYKKNKSAKTLEFGPYSKYWYDYLLQYKKDYYGGE